MATCTLCKKRDAIFGRRYSGENLCRRCFSKSIEDKVRRTISKYNLLGPRENVMIGVSGGKDSVTLLHILSKIEKIFPYVTLCVGTVDEGIKHYRDEALKIAERNCKKVGVDQIVVSFKEMFGYELDDIVQLIRNKRTNGLTPCSYCGVLRRKALNNLAKEVEATKLAIGHSLDDETQTILLNIFHGDPMRIARSKPITSVVHPHFVQRVKPFCLIPEKEIVFYAYLKGIEFQCIDCPYAQTALRNDIRNILNQMEHKHSGTLFTIFNSIEKIRPALETVSEEVKFSNCKLCGDPTVGDICRPCEMLQDLKIL